MNTSFILCVLLGVSAAVLGQSKTEQLKAPKEVLQNFSRMELEGARLTPEGRSKTASLLVQPSIAPPDPINIVSDNFEVHEAPATDGSVKLDLYFPYFYGWLDSVMRFKAAPHVAPGNGLKREGINVEYVLVLTKKLGGLETDKREGRETTGAQAWIIETPPPYGTISLATAIRYVTEMRNNSTDPTIKKNAGQTLAMLRKLHQ